MKVSGYFFLLFLLFNFFRVEANEIDLYEVKLSEKISNSSTIFFGKVVSKTAAWNEEESMIFTDNLILVYEVYKGVLDSNVVLIRTEGGIVDNFEIRTSSLLNLNIGEEGMFFCNIISGQNSFDVFSSKQGFLKYVDQKTNVVCPFFNETTSIFETYLISVLGEPQVLTSYSGSTNIIQYQNPVLYGNDIFISPAVLPAGTGHIISIIGVGFGNSGPSSTEFVAFASADDGGAGIYIQSPMLNYLVWTDTLIKVIVPTGAGTGLVKVVTSSITFTSSVDLVVPFSIINTANGSIPFLYDSNTSGGMTWTFNMSIIGAPSTAFNRARNTWRCATGVNWSTATTTTPIGQSSSDGVNVIYIGVTPTGVLGICYSYYLSCGTGQSYVIGQDIVFKNTTSWNFSINNPSSSQFDFESVALHELGHAHLLGHVIDNTDPMHFATSVSMVKRVLSDYNVIAGNLVMELSTNNSICGLTSHSQVFPNGCIQPNLTDVWLLQSFQSANDSTCFGLSPIFVDFVNLGVDTVWQAEIEWSINGIQQPSVIWSGSLAFGQMESNFLLGSSIFSDIDYDVEIWVNMINGSSDFVQENDSITLSFHPTSCTPDDATLTMATFFNPLTCYTNVPIMVKVHNPGENTLTSCWLFFQGNNGLIDSVFWTGNLLHGQSSLSVMVTVFNDFTYQNTFKIWSKFPNGVQDTYVANDTTIGNFTLNMLQGTYTVGGINPDFADMNQVFDLLDSYGVCDTVVFNIRNGVYIVETAVDSIYAINQNYNITFQPESGNVNDVFITSDPTPLLHFKRAHNLVFKNLTFQYDSTSYSTNNGLGFDNVDFLTMDGNIFNDVHISIGSSLSNYTSDSARFINNTFHKSSFTSDAPYNSTSCGNGILFENNLVTNEPNTMTSSGIYFNGSNGIIFRNNEINSSGLKINYRGGDVDIYNNRINNKGGIDIIKTTAILDTGLIRVYNNAVSWSVNNIGPVSAVLSFQYLPKIFLAHNTVNFKYNYPYITDHNAACLINHVDSSTILNNIFANKGGGLIYNVDDNGFFYRNNNLYFTEGNFGWTPGSGSGTYYPSLANFITAFSSDANSSMEEPFFAQEENLLVMNSGDIDNLGMPIPWISNDMVDSLRSPVTPDVGAFEFHQFDYDIAIENYLNINDSIFCQGQSIDLYIPFSNNGILPIDSFYVYFSLEGSVVDTILVYSSILPGQSDTVFIGNYVFNEAINEVSVSCGSPNGFQDTMFYNNGATFTVLPRLNGIYTVGNSGSDFLNISEAITSLNVGVCGPVTFLLKDGIHDNPGTTFFIPGNNATNTVTFQSESLDSSTTFITASDPLDNLKFKRAQYISFKDLSFYGKIHFDSVHAFSFDECHFISGGMEDYGLAPKMIDSLKIENCHFNNFYIKFGNHGILNNLHFIKNQFEGQSYFQIDRTNNYQVNLENIFVQGNSFTSSGYIIGNSGYLLKLIKCDNIEISGNNFNSTYSGIYISGTSIGINHIFNNFIHTYVAFFLNFNTNLHLYNNSIYSIGISAPGNNSIYFHNNIFYIAPGGAAFQFGGFTSSIPTFYSNNNIIFGEINQIATSTSLGYISWADWVGTHGKDVNSVYGNPGFISLSDLHVNSLFADGNAISSIAPIFDIDGELRNSVYPDIGADEFVFDSSLVLDVSAQSLLQPLNSDCFVNDSVSAFFSNNSTDTLFNAVVSFKVNTVTINSFLWTGTLLPNQGINIFLGTYNFIPGATYNILVNITNPNNLYDGLPANNSLLYTYKAYKEANITSSANFICGIDSLTLTSETSGIGSYTLWSNNNSNNSIVVSNQGEYWVEVTNQYGCFSSDTMQILWYPAPVQINISSLNTMFCNGGTLVVTVDSILSGNSYVWNWTGADTSAITINNSVLITLTTYDMNGCSTFDTQQFYEINNPTSSFIQLSDSLLLANNLGQGFMFQWLLNGDTIVGATDSVYALSVEGNYSLITTNSIGCSSVSNSLNVDLSGVGLNELHEENINVYPIPFDSELSIEVCKNQSFEKVELLDAQGKLLLSSITENKFITLDTENLASGLYYVVIQSEDRRLIYKVVKGKFN